MVINTIKPGRARPAPVNAPLACPNSVSVETREVHRDEFSCPPAEVVNSACNELFTDTGLADEVVKCTVPHAVDGNVHVVERGADHHGEAWMRRL
jgi:hypothetical protein